MVSQVLDSVGITIQEKLKETNSSFQLKLAQEAQDAQNQRAETDFDIASLKERMEAIDQGLTEVAWFVMDSLKIHSSTRKCTSLNRTSGTT